MQGKQRSLINAFHSKFSNHQINSVFFEKKPDEDNDYPDNKHKDGNPVDTMHVADPATRGRIRILLFNIQVFSNLTEYSHKILSVQIY